VLANPAVLAAILLAAIVFFAPWWVQVLGVVAVIIATGALIARYQRRQDILRGQGLDEIDSMDGDQFEQRLWRLFTDLGYAVERTQYRGDWGADLVLSRIGERTVVQAKRYGKNVGIEAIQQVVAAKVRYGCSKALVVTNAHYTKAAQEHAKDNGVELWDRFRLLEALRDSQRGA